MAFGQNLLEGFAQAAGDQPTVQRIENEKSDRKATQHEELQAQTQSILDDVAGLQKRRSTLDPKHPNYQQDLESNDKALHDARQALTDLYHPEQNPGALAHLGGFIRQHLSKNKAPVTPGQAKKSFADIMAPIDAAAATSGSATTDSNPFAKEKKQLLDIGWSEADAERAIRTKVGTEARAGKVSDYGQGLKRFVESEGGDPDNPTAAQEQAYREQRKGTAGGTSKFSQEAAVYETHWGKKIKEWSPEQLAFFNQKMAYDSQRNGESRTTKIVKDEYGNNIPVEVTTERGAGSPPVEPGMTPGAAKDRMRPAASSARVGKPLGIQSATPEITKAGTERDGAVALAKTADEMAKKPNDAVNVKGFAIALERARAGRFTSLALDKMLEAGWGNKLETWANAPTTGSYPADIIRQLVDAAHTNLRAKEEAFKAAHGPVAAGGTTASTGKAVSLAKAKLLPQMKGKSDDEIRKAIEASGHTVKP
jgi:hypothetical protein